MRIESSIKGWFAVVAVSVSAVSCDMLDITQDNKLSVSNMWKTAEQVEGSTYGIYSELRSNFVQSQINVFYWGELRVGEYMWGPSSLFNVWVGREVIQNTMTANITSCGWSKLYSAIDQANAVLKYAPDTAIPMTDAKRNWAMGQAYFARAYAYFWAARLWGDVPLNLRPIESVDQPETYPVRAPKADVYARIGSDIESALALSDALGSDKYLATKTAVLMLKAEYCLWMYSAQKGGDAYLDGAEDALEAIGISPSLLCDDYGQIFDRMADNAKPSKNSKDGLRPLQRPDRIQDGRLQLVFRLSRSLRGQGLSGQARADLRDAVARLRRGIPRKTPRQPRQPGRHPCQVQSGRGRLRRRRRPADLLPQVSRRHRVPARWCSTPI